MFRESTSGMFFERQVVLYSWKKPLGPTATATAAARIIAKRKLELQDAGSGRRLVLVPGSSSWLPSWVVSRGRYTTRKHATRRNQKKIFTRKMMGPIFYVPPVLHWLPLLCCECRAKLQAFDALSLSLCLTLSHTLMLTFSLALSLLGTLLKSMKFRRCMKEGVCEFQTRVSSQSVLSELLKSELSALLNREIKTI